MYYVYLRDCLASIANVPREDSLLSHINFLTRMIIFIVFIE